jgi:hypothetical protein
MSNPIGPGGKPTGPRWQRSDLWGRKAPAATRPYRAIVGRRLGQVTHSVGERLPGYTGGVFSECMHHRLLVQTRSQSTVWAGKKSLKDLKPRSFSDLQIDA